MSTRSNIIITDRGARHFLYHHHDGYPEGVGVQLQKCAKQWFDKYSFPWASLIANKLIKDEMGLNDKEYEITTDVHGDIDYLYVVNIKARTIRCYAVRGYDETLSEIARRENLVSIPEWDGTPTMYEPQKKED